MQADDIDIEAALGATGIIAVIALIASIIFAIGIGCVTDSVGAAFIALGLFISVIAYGIYLRLNQLKVWNGEQDA